MIYSRRKLIKGLLSLLLLFPFIYLALLSVAGRWPFPDIVPPSLTLQNWINVFLVEGDLSYSFGISVLISLSVAFTATICGFVTSKFIAYSRSREKLMLLSYFPFILSPVIYAACIYYYFIYMDLSGNITGVIIAQLIIAYPYAVIIFSGFWSRRLRSMENLVTTLGGSNLQAYIKVLLPQAKGMLLICFFQTYLISWFEYGLTTIIGVGKVQTLTIKVFQYISEANIYYAAIAACLLILPPAFLLYVNKRFLFKTQF